MTGAQNKLRMRDSVGLKGRGPGKDGDGGVVASWSAAGVGTGGVCSFLDSRNSGPLYLDGWRDLQTL